MDQFPAPPYPGMRVAPPTPSARRGVLRWALGVAAVLAALLTGLCTLWLIGYETGVVPFLAGLVAAALPVPVYVTLVLWLDRYEPEPPWMLAAAFFWGALVAVFFAIIINSVGVLVVSAFAGDSAAESYGMVVSAPVVEETAKALVLFILYFWRRDEFDGVTDGVIYAAMVGLGFAMTENVKYYGMAVAEDNAVGVFVVRGIFSPFAHPLFTGMTGIGLGLAAQTTKRWVKYVAPAVGFGAAVLFHALWNASARLTSAYEDGAYVLLTYFLLMVPTFFGMLLVIFLSLRREGRVLREHLRPEVLRGLITEADYDCLCSVAGRAGATYRALARGGFSHWRARVRYNRAASELAFHRSRVARGIQPRGAAPHEVEADYVQQLYRLRLQLEGK
ncbi:MAG TPA: PrsW family intramembrane metalloprotease [Pyrinomonadaceae bacterium]|nr:PrsW family intramembrane metalloprotease [Pyrinomonadaceae bacterium]